ncbi:uncharacterized protein LOC108673090 [Hyalella azteca]|uniref:Uncharacterized protein LOC108673090 n=1 Tax=Hyalella azteca TaxID=294128 RepID=A0A8B7NTN4_HYAAZ|nr:uncharacterized protein LOC108673090 [Hyalella azteca]
MESLTLPDTPRPPSLSLMNCVADGVEALARTVQAYAPSSKRYDQISIMEPELLEVEEQRRLLGLLHVSGVRTYGSGVTRIMVHSYDDEANLLITDEPPPARDLDQSIKNDGCCVC